MGLSLDLAKQLKEMILKKGTAEASRAVGSYRQKLEERCYLRKVLVMNNKFLLWKDDLQKTVVNTAAKKKKKT